MHKKKLKSMLTLTAYYSKSRLKFLWNKRKNYTVLNRQSQKLMQIEKHAFNSRNPKVALR